VTAPFEMTDLPEFPAERPARQPFSLPAGYHDLLRHEVSAVLNRGTSEPAWLVAGYEAYKSCVGDVVRFSSETTRPGYPNISASIGRFSADFMSKADPPRHSAMRRAVAAEFSVRRMETLRCRVADIVEDLAAGMRAQGSPGDLYNDFAVKVPNYVICEMLGVAASSRDDVHRLVTTFMQFDPGRTEERTRSLEQEYEQFVAALLDQKRADPGDDIVSRLVADPTPTLTDRDRHSIVAELINGGFDSTAGAIAIGIVLLLEHPEQLAALRSDRGLVKQTAEEIVRFSSITTTGRRRTATESTEIAGCPMKAGEGVIAMEIIANRDPVVFDAPDEFNIFRSNARSHLGYGWGPHMCVGAPLARLELDVVLNVVCDVFPTLRLDVPSTELRFRSQSVFYSPEAVPVSW
jgi:cytochrome P450